MRYAAYTAAFIVAFCLGIEAKEATLPRVTWVIEPHAMRFDILVDSKDGGGTFTCEPVYDATEGSQTLWQIVSWSCDRPRMLLK